MSYNKLEVCVSDADVLVKLSITGNLGLLGEIFNKIFIPEIVHAEAQRKIATRSKGVSLAQAINENWLEVISVKDKDRFLFEERQSMNVFFESAKDFVDRGEAEAAALANELRVLIMISDDRGAGKYLSDFTDIIGLTHIEILCIAIALGIKSEEEAKDIFESINATRTKPHGNSFEVLKNRGMDKLYTQNILK